MDLPRIEAAVREILAEEVATGQPVFTWQKSFTIGITGNLTSVAVAGAISGQATFVANVVWPDPPDNDPNTPDGRRELPCAWAP